MFTNRSPRNRKNTSQEEKDKMDGVRNGSPT